MENTDNKNKVIMKEIDWEQRRYEIAKDVLCSYVIKFDNGNKWMAQCAVECADALIEELKKTSLKNSCDGKEEA